MHHPSPPRQASPRLVGSNDVFGSFGWPRRAGSRKPEIAVYSLELGVTGLRGWLDGLDGREGGPEQLHV